MYFTKETEGYDIIINAVKEKYEYREVIVMIKLKKAAAVLMAGLIVCSTPMTAMATEGDTAVVEDLIDSGIDSIAADPDKAVDIIMYAKDLVDQQNITEEEIRGAIDSAASHFGISISDSEKSSLVNVIQKMLSLNIDEDQLRSNVNTVYDKLQDLGVDKDDVKGIVARVIDFIKSIFA